MTKLALVMSHREGYDILGSIPQRNHNPLDLRHSPHSHHLNNAPDAIGIIDNDVEGWADADRQLEIYAQRGLTIEEMIKIFAPPNENATYSYIDFVCSKMFCNPWDKVSDIIKKS